MKKSLLIVLLFIASLFVMISCGDEPPANEPDTYRVMVGVSDGFSVISQNPIDVAEGGTAEFVIKIADG